MTTSVLRWLVWLGVSYVIFALGFIVGRATTLGDVIISR